MNKKRGFTLVELVVLLAIFTIICLIAFRMIYQVIENAKVVTAKAQISQLAAALERVKDDTGYYPVNLSDLTLSSTPTGITRGWTGPYVTEGIPRDPWGHSYFYTVPPTTLVATPPIIRETGKPGIQDYDFSVTYVQAATLQVTNDGVTDGVVYVNGVEIISPNQFKKQTSTMSVSLNLLNGNNVLEVYVGSNPGTSYLVTISSTIPTGSYFTVGSYGKDDAPGGKGFNKDVTWVSNKYPNFQ